MGGLNNNRVEVVNRKGCSKLFIGSSPSFEPMPLSPVASSLGSEPVTVRSTGPFSALVICVTGLSKEARKQVMEATERLGGQYSPSLHPQWSACCKWLPEGLGSQSTCLDWWTCKAQGIRCTGDKTVHCLVDDTSNISPEMDVMMMTTFPISQSMYYFYWYHSSVDLNLGYSVSGRKFEHALKHGSRNGLFIVTLGWFVDSVKRNVRLSESLYTVKGVGENGSRVDELKWLVSTASESSCLPASFHDTKKIDMVGKPHVRYSRSDPKNSLSSMLSGHTLYIDSDISDELRNKVLEAASKEGALVVDRWFVGCNASYVVCEGNSLHRYVGHSNNIVTPLWILKTAKDRYLQRLVHMSADLARQIGTVLENSQNGIEEEVNNAGNFSQDTPSFRSNASYEERQQVVHLAKTGVRNRRGRRMQTCQTPIRPISPSSLLDSICWTISEPTSTASVFTDSCSVEDVNEHQSIFFDANGDGQDSRASFTNSTRSLTESERNELIFKNHFLTILFPVDRFSEMGPSSRTYFSNNGFTCLQVLDYIYSFYQENMLSHEIEAAIHTDSRHADRLRALYSSKETVECGGNMIFKRIDFLGSRRSFEMLKRVSGDNNSNVYELLIRA
ncbi:DNA topoisomerase 2-binding 1-A [Gossypium arboreum]|uniref:DNA topoisomerase 2-binding 1-A n=1 Tax=Gossypium arboreum TaxID=29729 RepID=A0A0B0MB55_GOSAR|nr:DNA topoisomerase 2-binding 1-A [Gossypium arboreum]